MAKRVTLSQIGRRAGVSDVAVSAALGLLARNSSVRLSVSKAQMIRRVAEEMGYQPNLLARAFRRQSTGVVGVLFRVVSNPLSVSYLVDCIHRELLGRDLQVNLSPYQSSFAVLEASIRKQLAWQVNGLILCHAFDHDDPTGRFAELEQALDAVEVPLVLVESTIPTTRARARVQVDLEQASFDAAAYLLKLGHRRLAYVGDMSGAYQRRRAGVERALARRRGARVEYLVLEMDPKAPMIQRHILAATAMGRRIAHMPHRPTGLICNNDQTAVSVVRGLQDEGVEVPGEVSVTGYDDSDLAVLCRPALTSFSPPVEEVARQAVALLLDQPGGGKRGGRPPQHVLKARLTPRGTTAPAARAGRPGRANSLVRPHPPG